MGPSQSTWFLGVFPGTGAREGGDLLLEFWLWVQIAGGVRWDVGLGARDGGGMGERRHLYNFLLAPMTHKERGLLYIYKGQAQVLF